MAGLLLFAGGIYAILSCLPDLSSMRNGNASIAHVFVIVFCLAGVAGVLFAIMHFRVAQSYYGAATTGSTIPASYLVIVFMILFFPMGTVLGAYALIARKARIREIEESEPAPPQDGSPAAGSPSGEA